MGNQHPATPPQGDHAPLPGISSSQIRAKLLQSPLIARFAAVQHDLPGCLGAVSAAERAFTEVLAQAFQEGRVLALEQTWAYHQAHLALFRALDEADPTGANRLAVGILGIGQEALEALASVRERAARFASTLPPPDAWAKFYSGEVVPIWSRLAGSLRRCEDCGALFTPARQDQRFCSDGCSARRRNRGRNTTKSKDARVRSHLATCVMCQAGNLCDLVERRIPSGKASKRDVMARRPVLYRDG